MAGTLLGVRDWLRVPCPDCGKCEDVPVEIEGAGSLHGHLHVAFKNATVPHACQPVRSPQISPAEAAQVG